MKITPVILRLLFALIALFTYGNSWAGTSFLYTASLYDPTSNPPGSLNQFGVDPVSGALSSLGAPASGVIGDLAAHPNGKYLYSGGSYFNEFNYTSFNGITVYTVDPNTGVATVSQSVNAPVVSGYGNANAYISVHPSGKWLYAKGSGNILQFSIDQASGALTYVGVVATQTMNNGFFVDPSGLHAYVPTSQWDVANVIYVYDIDQSTGTFTLKQSLSTPYDGYIYSMAFTPGGNYVYATGLLGFYSSGGSSIVQFGINPDGTLFQVGLTLISGNITAQKIVLDPNGQFAFVGLSPNTSPQCGSNCLQVYSVASGSGALNYLASYDANNGNPYNGGITDLAVDPQTDTLYTSTYYTNLVSTFQYNLAGSLTLAGITNPAGSDPSAMVLVTQQAGSPTLSFSAEAGYGTVGVNPASGTTATLFTYKVVYTDAANTAPNPIEVCIDALPCSMMSVDAAAASTLRDGDYTNGEQYVYSTTLPVGAHTYYFTASDGTNIVDLPATGTLSGPPVALPATITTSSLAGGEVSVAYNATIAASGGTNPIGSWSAPGLPPGLSINASTGVITGTPTTAGTYSFTVSATDAASVSFNKLLSIVVAGSGVDLTVSALSSPSVGGSVYPGGSITINDTVTNGGGSATTTTVAVSYYLSTDATITTSDMMIGSRGFPTLAGGASNSGTTTLTLPSSLAPGTYYIGAIVNPTDAQVESNYSNNSRATVGTFTVTSSVDLTVSALSSPSVGGGVNAGESITISDTVTNGGASPSTTTVAVAYYLSTDATITTSDMMIGSRSVPTLAGGASNSGTATLTLPSSLTPGTYYIGAIVNPTDAQVETSYSNNSRATSGVITVTSGVDLTVSALSSPSAGGSVTRGSSITINYTVANTGSTKTTTQVAVAFYLSTDATITTSDNMRGSASVPVLAAGASSSGSISVIVPYALTPGTYYIGAIVNPSSAQVETSYSNNSKTVLSPLTVH